MKKIPLLIFSAVCLGLLLYVGFTRNNSAPQEMTSKSQVSIEPKSGEPLPSPTSSQYTASFEIYTNGTKRIFTDAKYHNQSEDVFIEESDPHLIQVKKSGITWDAFFKTLPFSLTKQCLVTGTKQTFCTSDAGTLQFNLNGQDVPDALDVVIAPNDSLRVEFSAE